MSGRGGACWGTRGGVRTSIFSYKAVCSRQSKIKEEPETGTNARNPSTGNDLCGHVPVWTYQEGWAQAVEVTFGN